MDNVDDALEEQQIERELHDQQARTHELLRKVDFGLQVRQFLAGDIGSRILRDTEIETKDLLEALSDLDPDNKVERAEMRLIRQKLGILAHWQDAFARYIDAGHAAEVELNEGQTFVADA